MMRQKININNPKHVTVLSRYGLQGLDLTHGSHVTFEQGEFLSHAGESMESIYFVICGKAKVFLNLSTGRQLLLAYFTSKGIIGDIELMTNKPVNYTTVQAVTEFSCIALPLNIYGSTLKNNNTFLNYVAVELAEKLTQRVVNGAITTLQPIESRVCAYIAQAADNDFFRETLTDVAVIVGASYRHLLRCLGKLCSEGVLVKESNGFRIANRRVLDSKAGDLYVLK
ncbi:MAG: cyclic nucleotide-binding domain-containing protein [Firmicutes bacterium]|nr:cyclic nucleotide-binding domain-containing protein [Bacillota bacterium]